MNGFQFYICRILSSIEQGFLTARTAHEVCGPEYEKCYKFYLKNKDIRFPPFIRSGDLLMDLTDEGQEMFEQRLDENGIDEPTDEEIERFHGEIIEELKEKYKDMIELDRALG